MKTHRFFVKEKIDDQKKIVISDEMLIHQWRNVFRMKVGDMLVLLDNSGFEYPARFLKLEKTEAEFEISKKIKNEVTPKREVVLCQSLVKKDKFEWIVQKGTELGISAFWPVISERSEKKGLNMERLRVIAREAAEQSGRGKIPRVHEPQKLSEILNSIKNDAVVFDASGSPFLTLNFTLSTFNLFVGPEGGFTPPELELFKSKNIPIVSIGNMTLRAETAAIAISSLLLL